MLVGHTHVGGQDRELQEWHAPHRLQAMQVVPQNQEGRMEKTLMMKSLVVLVLIVALAGCSIEKVMLSSARSKEALANAELANAEAAVASAEAAVVSAEAERTIAEALLLDEQNESELLTLTEEAITTTKHALTIIDKQARRQARHAALEFWGFVIGSGALLGTLMYLVSRVAAERRLELEIRRIEVLNGRRRFSFSSTMPKTIVYGRYHE
jgi:hypothetical protein